MTTTSTITPELLDQLLANYQKPEDLTGEDRLFNWSHRARLFRLAQLVLGGEMATTLQPAPEAQPIDFGV